MHVLILGVIRDCDPPITYPSSTSHTPVPDDLDMDVDSEPDIPAEGMFYICFIVFVYMLFV